MKGFGMAHDPDTKSGTSKGYRLISYKIILPSLSLSVTI